MVSGSDVTVNCTVELGSAMMESELSLLIVDVQLSRDGAPIALSGPTVSRTTFIYTAQLNSFGRNDSGNYTCTATVRPQPALTFLTGVGRTFNTAKITTGIYIVTGCYNQCWIKIFTMHALGVYFSIQSREVSNNSYLLITDIGEGDCGALFCFTDNTLCCSDTRTGLGQWFYPNGSLIGTKSDGQNFYVDRGPSVIRLNRRNNATSISGQFCCKVPDAASVSISVCVNVVGKTMCKQRATNVV